MLKTVGNPSTRYGDQTIIDGNLVIGTSGKGIDFSATPGTGTSELLDDYEEGTFQAVITFGGGTTGQAYSVRTCSYTKIGDRVSVSGYLELTNKGSSTGAMKIEGLPFVLNASAASLVSVAVMISNVTYTGQIMMYGVFGTATVEVQQMTEAGASSALTNANAANNTAVVFGFTYQT